MAVIKRPEINNIPYEEFQDNETLEKLVQELNENGVGVMVGQLDKLIDWGRSNSLWPLTFATSCCGIEFMAVAAARYDMARFGFEITRNSPRHWWLRHLRWSFHHEFSRGEGCGQGDSCGRLRARLPSTSRSLLVWHDAVAA